MLSDSQCPANHGLAGLCIRVCHGADAGGRHPSFTFGIFERIRLYRLAIGVETSRGVVDEIVVFQSRGDDLPPNRVGQGNVGANIQTEPAFSPACGAGSTWIDDEKTRARREKGVRHYLCAAPFGPFRQMVPDPIFPPAAQALEQMMEENRVRLARVGAPEEADIGLLDLLEGASAPPGSKHSRQTDDARSVSGPVAAIDIVAADHHAGKLLGHEVHFVGALGATKKPKGARAVAIYNGLEDGGGPIHSFVPACRPKSGGFAK